jgi:hypothetical protein
MLTSQHHAHTVPGRDHVSEKSIELGGGFFHCFALRFAIASAERAGIGEYARAASIDLCFSSCMSCVTVMLPAAAQVHSSAALPRLRLCSVNVLLTRCVGFNASQ